MIDQFILYDQALITWMTNNIVSALPTHSVQILVAVPMKGYAEVTTGRIIDNETLTLPRISITRLGKTLAPDRFNATRIRRLGWAHNDGTHRAIRAGKYPTPIDINYQIDLWSEYVRDMNLLEQKLLFEFAFSYIYLQVRPDDVWGDKIYPIFLDGEIADNSDLEVGENDRSIRKTLSIRAECWIWDQDTVAPVNVVKRFELQYRDDTDGGDVLLDTDFIPPYITLATGDGSTTDFGPFTLENLPVLEHTPVIQTVIGASTELAHDDGAGLIIGDKTSGTINYTTGELSLSFTSPPDNGQPITVTYFMRIV